MPLAIDSAEMHYSEPTASWLRERTRFESLVISFVSRKGPPWASDVAAVLQHQIAVAEAFPRLVEDSALHLCRPADPIRSDGRRILLGVTPSSPYDMRLLDILDDAARAGRLCGYRVDVFDCFAVKSADEVERNIPGIGGAWQTPLIGGWEDGMQVVANWGQHARDALLRYYGLASDWWRGRLCAGYRQAPIGHGHGHGAIAAGHSEYIHETGDRSVVRGHLPPRSRPERGCGLGWLSSA